MLKRNKNRYSGRSVRYFDYRLGVVNSKKPRIATVFLPGLIVLSILGGGGFYGYSLYEKPVTNARANAAPIEVETVAEQYNDQTDQKSYQAKEDSMLASSIKSKIKKMPAGSEWAVSIRDLNSGRMANVNADIQMDSASLYKLFLLAPLEKKLSADNWKSKLGTQSIEQCVDLMIRVSDNDCPQAIGSFINWKTVDTYNQSLGFANTVIGTKGSQVTTTRDVSELVFRLQNSQMLSDKARRIVFDALYEQKFRSGVPTGCGQDCLVGNKTGDLSNVKHDVAIVKHDDAHYVVAIMSSGNSTWQQVADLASSIDEAMRP